MRILLINPYYPISETPSPPLGLAYLAGALERHDMEVRVLDLVVYPYNKKILENILNDFQPHVVGATCVTMSFNDAQRVIHDVKTICPEIITVMGGPHVTFCAKQSLAQFPELDIVVLGEGENTLVSIVKEAERKRAWPAISGIAFRDEYGIHTTTPRPAPIQPEQLPFPARHLLPLGRYRALNMPITMTTSRGCPFHCIFCVGRKLLGAKVRFRDPINVVDELEGISGFGFHQINIADDLFTGNKRHCIAICDEIIKRGLNVAWTAFARVDTVSIEILEKMKQAGCHTVSFGVESANRHILKITKKGITPEQVISAIGLCNQVGISPHASFILGLPGESPETLAETIEFSKNLKQMGVSFGFHLLAPFPGTEVREKAEDLGIKILTNDWSQYHANRPITETRSVTRDMLDEIVSEWESDFHTWLGQIAEGIKNGTALEHEKKQYENLEQTAIIYDLMMHSTLETHGRWPNALGQLSPRELLRDLAQRINGASRHPPQLLYRTLSGVYARGQLTFLKDPDGIRCSWVDYL